MRLCSSLVGAAGGWRGPVLGCSSCVASVWQAECAALPPRLDVNRPHSQLAHPGCFVPGAPAVWNWWLLTLFFLCGSAASLRAWARKRRGRSIRGSSSGDGAAELAAQPGTSQQQQHLQRRMRHKQQLAGGDDLPADWLDRAVIAVFSTELPVGLLLVPLVVLWLLPGAFCWPASCHSCPRSVMHAGQRVCCVATAAPRLLVACPVSCARPTPAGLCYA